MVFCFVTDNLLLLDPLRRGTSPMLATIPTTALSTELAEMVDKAREYADASKASATRKAYASDLADFHAFADRHSAPTLPADPALVALYVTHLAESKTVATIKRRLVAIAQTHKAASLANPVAHPKVREVFKGIARTKGVAQHRKAALTDDLLGRLLLALPGTGLKAKRDRALLLLGFACASRRSELAALDVEDLAFDARGLAVTIRRSKTDQEGKGSIIGVPFIPNAGLCAARAVRAWLDAARIIEGPVFRTFSKGGRIQANRIDGRDVARLVQKVAERAGLDGDFGGHSLRAGFVTAAAQKGASFAAIQAVSRHKTVEELSKYIRRADPFKDAALSTILG